MYLTYPCSLELLVLGKLLDPLPSPMIIPLNVALEVEMAVASTGKYPVLERLPAALTHK